MSSNLADLTLDLPADLPPVLTSSGQDEFKFGRSTPHPQILTSSGQEWQFQIWLLTSTP